jgi:CHAT domain-containing protein
VTVAALASRLSVSLAGDVLSAAVAQGTLLHRATQTIDPAAVAARARGLIEVLARGARQRALTQAALADLRTLGEDLYRALLPEATRGELADLAGSVLLLELDEALVGLPWELLHDGRAFLCRRFDLGRAVVTAAPRRAAPARELARPAQLAVLLSDARRDLPRLAEEGEAIVDALEAHPGVVVHLTSAGTVDAARATLRDAELVHYAGHADYQQGDPGASSWAFADGPLDARAIRALGRLPLFVFANGCASSHEPPAGDPARVFGLASAFLQGGTRFVLGTQWDVVDAQARVFAAAFYRELGRGRALGAAVRRARDAVIVAEGEGGLGWASYVLYGDPGAVLLEAAEAAAPPPFPSPVELGQRESLRAVGKRARPRRPPAPRARWPWLAAGLFSLVGALAAYWWAALR